jgi:hypothetical protein
MASESVLPNSHSDWTNLKGRLDTPDCAIVFEDGRTISPTLSEKTLVDANAYIYERQLGDSELSYYLPSRESGVNDMYLHLGFRAPTAFVRRERVCMVWAILRIRHPLLSSKVQMHDYNDVRFVYSAPASPEGALQGAESNMEYKSSTKDELIDEYLNGSRTLSNDRLSYLILSRPEQTENSASVQPGENELTESQQYDLLICATHFLGDGMALHQFANDFFSLLGSSKSQHELQTVLKDEWSSRWGAKVDNDASPLPSSMEAQFVPDDKKFRRAVARVDFRKSQSKLIGGHSFPRRTKQPCRTIVPTVPYRAELTKKMLKTCKAHGVSISSALFAICNMAWARISFEKKELPTMMYSALNLRPYLVPPTLNDSYWFLAIGYFNVILPSFVPRSGDIAAVLWHRARIAKEQSTRAAKSIMVVSRSREMALERGQRARAWAKEDDEKAFGIWKAPPPNPPRVESHPPAPSTALIGLSLLGNLDGMYKHADFPKIELHTLTTGSRQRPGGMLLFGYTFVGKLFVSLGYDENGFDKDVVERFWANVLGSIDEFLT